jgi:metal-responsive CopG/Arc/MetJ family transcriptional regulator
MVNVQNSERQYVVLSVTMRPYILAALDSYCRARGVHRSTVIDEAVKEKLGMVVA